MDNLIYCISCLQLIIRRVTVIELLDSVIVVPKWCPEPDKGIT